MSGNVKHSCNGGYQQNTFEVYEREIEKITWVHLQIKALSRLFVLTAPDGQY